MPFMSPQRDASRREQVTERLPRNGGNKRTKAAFGKICLPAFTVLLRSTLEALPGGYRWRALIRTPRGLNQSPLNHVLFAPRPSP